MSVKKNIFILLLLQSCYLFSKKTIIVLYGCSSVGKTSISQALNKTLPGNWKYIPANKFHSSGNHSGNYLLWKEINRTVDQGYNVMVDTHSSEFLVDSSQNITMLTVMLHCSPDKLIEHINMRNNSDDRNTHRAVSTVFKEFCNKYRVISKKEESLETLDREKLLKNYGFFTTLAIKKSLINNFFNTKDQKKAYITTLFTNYDCFVDTGKMSIAACAKKIKNALTIKASA